MGDLVYLPVISTLDVPAERVLEMAMKELLKTVVVMGYDQEGELYFASSVADGGDVLWLMAQCKKRLLEVQ